MVQLCLKKFKLLVIALVAAGIAAALSAYYLQQKFLSQKLVTTDTLISIPKSASAQKIAEILYRHHVINSKKIFLWLVKYYHLSARLQSGTYLVTGQETGLSLLHKLAQGQTYKISVKIIEGQRICDLVKLWTDNPAVMFDKSMLMWTSHSLEGLLYPDTYVQEYGASMLPVIQQAHKKMLLKLEEVWQNRSANLPFENAYELLIAASIIEKETALLSEKHVIASVIVNRLKLHMPLQMDPTVSYGMPGCESIILTGHDIKIDNPYNTYKHQGLPPTPIAQPSATSLLAAAHPDNTDYLYFVANNHGQHIFSATYQQHKKNIYAIGGEHGH